jgi:hypothetical protein
MEGLRLEPLDERHLALRKMFDCGEPELNAYLATRARNEVSRSVTAVHVLHDQENNRIARKLDLPTSSIPALL